MVNPKQGIAELGSHSRYLPAILPFLLKPS